MAAPLHFPWKIWKITRKQHAGKASLRVVIKAVGAFPKRDPSDLILCLKSDSSLINQSSFNLCICPPVAGGVTNT